MTKFKEMTPLKKIITIGALCGALTAIIGFSTYIYAKYTEYKDSTEEELQKRIKKVLQEETEFILLEIDTIHQELDSINHTIVDGSKFFAVGFRADGSGDLWYRNELGEMYKAYYDQDYDLWYYIDENGLPVYL